jgi:outer membrane protein OmpA-like peptidoglycan-associated protein
VKRGIEPERIRAIGFGESKPVADNSTSEGWAKNRRTEFIIVK